MKIFSKISLVLALGAILFGTSCVSNKKYDDLMAEKEALSEKCKSDKEEMQAKINELETNNSKLKTDVANTERELKNADMKLSDAEQKAAAVKAKIDRIKQQIKETVMAAKEADLDVEAKDVKLHVSLANEVLFRPGNADLSKEGKELISQLANVFKEEDMHIMVEGHTDEDPIRRSRYLFNDNWDLSCARAASAVRALIEGGVDPASLTAAGRAYYESVDGEVEGEDMKAAKRRIEFVLTPTLEGFEDL
ncbi:MAG: OmpA family protein [Saprospiraceae bacterium]|nr:OmpA family protein [Saprospiraceae bacterium]